VIFCLGTAQLGMRYGIVNYAGQPSSDEAARIVRHALACGVTTFDTAREYGQSEQIRGAALSNEARSRLRIITKLGLSTLTAHASEDLVRRAVDQSVEKSCDALRSEALDVLLLHSWKHRYGWNEAAWSRLLELKAQGRIQCLGGSVYEPSEAIEALREKQITYLQVPMNVLDWRWKEFGIELALRQRPDVLVYVRSVLLQGILAHPADRWPIVNGFDNAACVTALQKVAKRFRRESVADLCFAYVRSLTWASALVVGCETQEQLSRNLQLFSRPALSDEESRQVEREIPKAPLRLLNPSQWSNLHESHACCAS